MAQPWFNPEPFWYLFGIVVGGVGGAVIGVIGGIGGDQARRGQLQN